MMTNTWMAASTIETGICAALVQAVIQPATDVPDDRCAGTAAGGVIPATGCRLGSGSLVVSELRRGVRW
jgi:hypothetical protein